jgi:hypothetical protein
VIRAALLAAVLLASSAEALDVDLEAYRQARQGGALGVVTGRVAAEPRTPQAAPRPLAGSRVILLPRSGTLLTRLEQLKAGSRESSAAFAAAAPEMRKVREAYEREVWEAGAPELTPATLVDSDGVFRIPEVPAGPWLLYAWHSVPVDVSGARIGSRERGMFRPQARLRGFQSVTIWLREISVLPGATAEVELHDRNDWFRGVIEERELDTPRK